MISARKRAEPVFQGESMKRMLAIALTALALGSLMTVADDAIAQNPPVKGEVLEVKDVESYTYLKLKTADGEVWAAVTKAAVKKGAQVTIENAMVMNNFASKSLNRTFDKIIFGSLAGAGAGTGAAASAPPAAPAAGSVASMHKSAAPKAAEVPDVKVTKATGPQARTVAEIINKRSELKDKNVVVRAKVVKFTPEIMGKNWLHLQDGSGSSADGTNDLVVTTKDAAKVGDVVVASGVVRADVDIGGGYAFKAMVEDAKLQK